MMSRLFRPFTPKEYVDASTGIACKGHPLSVFAGLGIFHARVNSIHLNKTAVHSKKKIDDCLFVCLFVFFSFNALLGPYQL